jgi:large subunit ribosomal protein L1
MCHQTLEVAVQLGVDPRKPGQNIRGMVQVKLPLDECVRIRVWYHCFRVCPKLPHGTGKKASIAVFARGDKADEAKAAGMCRMVGPETDGL